MSDLTQFLPDEYQSPICNNYIEPKTYIEAYKEYRSRPFSIPREISLRRQELIEQGKLRY